LIDRETLVRAIAAAKKHGAAVCGLQMISTLKFVDSSSIVKSTPDRNKFFAIQTPQAFKKDIIVKAYKGSISPKITDDSMLVERLGHKVRVVKGSCRNIKVTVPEDLLFCEALL